MLSYYPFAKSYKVGILLMPTWQLGKPRLIVFRDHPAGEW